MDFKIIDPPLPSLARWRHMNQVARGESILRALEYEALDRLTISGKVLDFGGGQKSHYAKWLGDAQVSSVNIDAEFAPTHQVAPGDPPPFADGGFDAVVTFNTLEHVYDDAAAVQELSRVTRDGGELHIMVPFTFRVHGHPDDYNRHTPSWWGETLKRAGYTRAEVTPLVFGRRTTAQTVSGRGNKLLRPITGAAARLIDILSATVMFAGKDSYSGRQGAKVWAVSPGWYIHAVK